MGLLNQLFGSGKQCAACGKNVRPHSLPGGSATLRGTAKQLASQLRMEPDHAFICESCNNAVCPVCSGKKAGALGLRELVCTECGHHPLKKVYR